MAKLTKKSRGAGRPNRINKLEDTLTGAILTGSENLVDAYPRAVEYLISLLDNKIAGATPASRLQAAKLIKEACELTLDEMNSPDENENPSSSESDDTPLLRLASK